MGKRPVFDGVTTGILVIFEREGGVQSKNTHFGGGGGGGGGYEKCAILWKSHFFGHFYTKFRAVKTRKMFPVTVIFYSTPPTANLNSRVKSQLIMYCLDTRHPPKIDSTPPSEWQKWPFLALYRAVFGGSKRGDFGGGGGGGSDGKKEGFLHSSPMIPVYHIFLLFTESWTQK